MAQVSTIQSVKESIAKIVGADALLAMEASGRLVVTRSDLLDPASVPQVGRNSMAAVSRMVRNQGFALHLARIRQAKERAVAAIGRVDDIAIVRAADRDKWQMILADASEPGKWRIQTFDARGFSGHMVFKDKQEAVEYAAVNGYTERDDGALDRVFDTPAFQRGLFSADLIRRINMAELSFEQANVELARYDETQKVLASVASMGAQAFVGGQGRVMVILADRIKAGDESAVFLHEVTHKWGREVMAAGDWQQLVGRVRSWANRSRQSVERQIHDRAQVRVSTARVKSSLQDEEFFAYAVEEAVKLGVKPSAAALEDSAEAWLQQVVDTLERTLLAATEASQVGRLGVSSFPENLQQLIDLAYAMAQLESPARASKIWQRLSDEQQEQLNRMLQSQGLARITEELGTFDAGQGYFTPGRSALQGMTRELDGAKASEWLKWLKKDGARAGLAGQAQLGAHAGLEHWLAALGSTRLGDEHVRHFDEHGVSFKLVEHVGGFAAVVGQEPVDAVLRAIVPPGTGLVELAKLSVRSMPTADGGRTLHVLNAELFDATARLQAAKDDSQQFESRLRESYASFLHESSWRASDDKTANMRLASRMAAMTPMMDIAEHFQAQEQYLSLVHTLKRAQEVAQDLGAGAGWADVVVFRVLAEAAVHGFDSVELPASVVSVAGNAKLKGLIDADGLVHLTPDITRSLLSGLPRFDLGRDGDGDAAPAAWYFSKLERALGCAPKRLEGSSARQWSNWLNGNCARLGVKQQEIHWSGITEWLKLQEESPVYAAQVIAFVKANGVRVHEAVLSEDGADSLFFKPLRDARTDEWVVYDNSDQRIESFETPSAASEFIARHQAPSQRALMGHIRSGGLMGSGYRELLLTLGGAQKGSQKGFSSPDWDGDRAQPLGVLAHVRMDEQVGVDGQRVLMVHEVRSEWAQALASQSRIGGEGIGDMPFPAQQDWLALVMKRLVVLAAKEGFDGVAFASGQQVIEQNPFFKGLAGLQWVPSGLPSTQTPLVGGRLIGVGANGVRLWSRDLERPGEIASYVGNRLAKELLSSGNANGIGASGGSFSVGLSHIERARESVIDVYDRQIPRAMKHALALAGGEDEALKGTVRITQPDVGEVVLNGFAMTERIKGVLGDGVEKLPLFSTNDGVLKTPAGDPVVVYRGEHSPDGQWLKTRLPGLSFSTASVAATYAIEPNDREDVAGDMAPRVMAANLVMRRPLINTPDDPFLEMRDLVAAIGQERAVVLAKRYAAHIEETGAWLDGVDDARFDGDAGLAAYLDNNPGDVTSFYVDAYRILDDEEAVGWLQEAGYDGAVHGGNGVGAGEAEYRVFASDQVVPLWSSDALLPPEPSMDARVDAFLDYWKDREDGLPPYDEACRFTSHLIREYARSQGVAAELRAWSPFGQPTGIELTDLVATEPGNGAGSSVMQQLGAVADRLGLGVYLRPNGPRVREFYARHGYETASKNFFGFMVRYPSVDFDDDDGPFDGPGRPRGLTDTQQQAAEPAFSFAGEDAQDAPVASLHMARARLARGEDAQTVRAQTGWFSGVDGRWRFEIDDSSASLKPLSEVAQLALSQGGKVQVVLADVIDHPRLLHAYPALAGMPVELVQDRSGGLYVSGVDGDDPGQVVIGAFLREGKWQVLGFTILLHEVQHAIQRREGFAIGGTPSIQAWASGDLRPHLLGQTQALVDEMEPPSYEAYWGAERSAEGEAAYAEFLKEWHSPDYQRQLWQASQQGAAARVYQRLAGEVEARDVQRRAGLSAAQRLSTPPALSAGGDGLAQDLVVVFNGQDMHDASGINAAPVSLQEVRAIWAALGVKHFVSEKAGRIHLSQLIVPEHLRGQGVGTQAMQALAAYADASGQRLELSPSTDFGATSKARLQRFYRRFGFVANQGSRRDFTTTETMLREPKGAGFMDLRPNPDRQELRTYKVGDTTMILSVSPFDPGVVHLSSLRTPVTKRGKGSARAAMQALLAQADRQGVSINLTASALDRQTNQTGLGIFYRSLGFEVTGRRMNAWGHPEMVRHATPAQVGERQMPEMLEVDGVIRPTRNSRGMLIHAKPEAIEQFWRWYAGQGEPGLMDADGRPLVLYHGTNEDLDHLDPLRERAVRAPQSVHAVFATDDQKVASEFALYRSVWAGANVMPIYARTGKVLKIDGRGKPIRMVEAEIDTARLAAWSMSRRGDMAGVEQVWTALEALIGVNLSGMEPSIDETLRSYAKRMGFDAMVFNEVTDDVGPEIPRASNIHVLLDPVDIKSATGNLGAYDPQQDSLRMSVAQRPAAAPQEEAEVQEALARALSFSQPNLLGLPKASESMQWLAKGTNDVGPVYRGHGIELHAVAQIQQDDFDAEAGFARFGLMGHAARCVPGTRTYAFKVVQPGTLKVMGTLVSDVDQEGRIVSVHDIATVAPGKGHGTRVMTHLVANAPENTIKVQEITNESEEFWRRIHIGYIDTYRDAQLESGFIHRTPSTDVAQPVSGGHAHRAGDGADDRASTAKGSQLDPASAAVAGEMGRGQGQGLDFAAQWALISEREQRAREADLASDMVGLEVSEASEADSLAFADDLGLDFAHIGQRWVKDTRGADLKLYHGTSAMFAEFGSNPRGIFLSEDPAKAGTFKAIRKGGEPRVIEARIHVSKVWEVIRYGDDVPYSQMIDQSVDALKKQGYDAMHCPDDGVWIVFDPKQIDILRQDIDQEVDEADEVAARVAAEMEDVRQLYGKAPDWLKAPNGEPTKLSRRQWLLVRTDSFKAWFGDWQKDPINASKALDENGEPKVYFHGSKEAGFTEFDTDGRRKTDGTGAFFASSSQMARGYSGGSEETPVYLPEQIFKEPDLIDGLEIEKGILASVVVSSQGRKAWSWFESEQQAREELELAADDPIDSKEGYRVLVDGYEELVGDKQAVLDHLMDMRSKEAGMYEVFLNIRDMVDVDWGGQNWDQGPQEDVWDIEDAGGNQLDWAYSEEERDAMLASNPGSVAAHRTQSVYDSSDDAARQARQMDADGILIRNIWDTGPDGYADDGDVCVVFESENIKWADNVGSFDPGTSDIRFSMPVKEDVELPAKGAKKPLNLTLKAGHKGYFDAYVGKRRVGAICGWEDSRGEFVVMKVVVSAPYRRRGVATAMYRAVEEQAGRQLKPAVSLSDDGFEFWKAYRPQAVAEDLRHRLDELIGRQGVKNGREGIITKASGGTATLTHPDGMHTTVLRRELDDVLLPLEPDDGPGDGPGGPGGLPAGSSGEGADDEDQGAEVDAEDETTDTLTGAPAFRAWFSGSKVVDADGKPLVVYHGTAANISVFDAEKVGTSHADILNEYGGEVQDIDPSLFYFSDDVETANWYAKDSGKQAKGGANVMPVYLSLRNPLIVNYGGAGREYLSEDIIKAKKDGNDGVILRNFDDGGVSDHYIAFSPTQIKSAIGNNGDFDAQNPDIRFSFAGVQAATADVVTLADAKTLLAAGEDAESVRQKTNWFQGVDGAWRFEINDAQAQLINLRQGDDGVASRATYLADVLHHPALFAAYPSLRNLDVMIDIDPAKAVRGSFEAGTPGDAQFFGRTPEAHVTAPSTEAALDCLLHEIQHALQGIEGFAEGGSPKLMDAYGDKTPSTDFLYGMVKWNRWMRLCGYPDDKLMDPFADLVLNTEDVILADLETQGIWLASQAGISNGVIEEQMQRAFGNPSPQALSVFAARSAYEQYLRLAGEVEARNVEARRAMTDAQRLAASPASTQDVPGDEIIITVNGNAVQSLRVPADAKRSERQTDMKAFRNWFGGSKVVDAAGSPRVVYHGTVVRPDTDKVKSMGDIRAFDRLFTTQFRAPSLDTVGSWFSTNPGQGGAEMYSGNHPGSAIYPVYLSIQNPQITTFQLLQRRARLLANGKDDGRQIGAPEVDAYRQWLKATGKDGIKIEGSGNEGSTEFDQQEAWIALEPQQIKSAIGSNGDFDAENPDIRFSMSANPAGTDSDRFKEWFGPSKVVDADGKPQVVYHGTSANFSTFKPSDQGTFGKGIYFFNTREGGEQYGGWDGGEQRIVEAYVSLRNPWVVKAEFDTVAAFVEDFDSPIVEAVLALPGGRQLIDDAKAADSVDLAQFGDGLQLVLTQMGYDGIIADYGDGSKEIIAFRPEQVKSANENNGDFDAENPDIRFSMPQSGADKLNTALADVSAVAALSFEDYTDTEVELANIEVWDKGRGHGTRVMRRVVAEADKAGINLMLIPAGNAEKRDRLAQFYAQFGFEEDGYVMRRPAHAVRDALDLRDLDIRFSVPEAPAPVFFSALAKEVASLPAKTNTTDGWIELINGLAKAGKVRDEEVKWTGLADWLFQMEAQQRRIAREELVSFLEANSVRVEEVVLDTASLPWVVVDQATGGDKFYKECATEDEALDLVAEMGDDQYGALPPQDAPNAGRLTGPKYAKYTLPGGSNYREVLLTLPPNGPSPKISAELHELALANLNRQLTAVEAARRQELLRQLDAADKAQGYKSNHWDEYNIVAHIRLNDRVDANGRKTLFIEEIQSDWAQQGRKFGFVDDGAGERMPGLLGQYDTLNARRRELEANIANGDDADPRTQADIQAAIEVGGQMEALAEEMTRIRSASKEAIPLGPFVGKTDGWLGLALRRIMKIAVDGGYDHVAFVSGEQAADRFVLSKQVNKIEAYKSGSDTYGLRIDPIEGSRFYKSDLSVQGIEDHVGKDMAASLIEAADQYEHADSVYRTALRQSDVPEDVLDDLVAKRDAVKTVFSGMDLKVGGAGMKAFYGNVLPATLKPLLRKLGGAGLSQIQLGGGSGQPNEVSINGTVVSDVRTGNKLYFAGSADDALQWAENEGYTVVSGLSSQLGFAITPKMRDLLADGVPLFSFAGPQALTANLQSMVGAQTRIEEGDNPEVVRQETGWFAGADGRLRFEIDDSQAFAKGTDAYGDLLMRWYHAGVQRTGDQAYKVRLGDVLYHAKLFDAYPGLADLEVQMMPAGVAARGRLVIENGQPSIIQINEFLDSKTWVNVVLHELQHAIQETERFEPGSSPADFAAAADVGQQVEDVSLSAYREGYRRSAGEVEARNVQARQNLSQRERQATSPASTQDVADPILLGLRDKLLTDTDRAAVLDMGDGVIRVQRAQTGGGRLRAATGEAGDGIYAYFPKSAAMRNYYVGKRGQFDEVSLWDIDLDANRVVDLTLPANMTELLAYARAQFAQLERSMHGYVTPVVSAHNIQRFGRIVEGFVRAHRPWAGAWIIGHKGPGIPTSRQVVISDESAMLSAVERPKAMVGPTLSVSELQAEQDWLSALFGEQAPATAVPAVGALELNLDNEEVAHSLRAFAAQKQAEATEWASRQYKFNPKPLSLRGDGPRREETISVQRANESRRRKMVDTFMAQATAATDLALKVEAGLDFSRHWKGVEAAVERDIARNGGIGHAHGTKERMTEAYASTMLLGDAYGAFGDGALSSHLRQLVQVARGEVADVAMSVSASVRDVAAFGVWSQGLPFVEEDWNEYGGGPGVFVAYHGTTHSDITAFKRTGNPEGFLGEGPYFTTSSHDASENYAGEGVDLLARIENAAEGFGNQFEEDDAAAQEMLNAYFSASGIEEFVTAETTDAEFEALKESHGGEAINFAATRAIKGDSDGLVMKVFVRLSNPADTVRDQWLEVQWADDVAGADAHGVAGENGEDDEVEETIRDWDDLRGPIADWLNAAQIMVSDERVFNAYALAVVERVSDDGGLHMRDLFEMALEHFTEFSYRQESSAGAVFRDIAKEAGYDGVVMSAWRHFGPKPDASGRLTNKGMSGIDQETVHLVPFSSSQVKSATGNSGAYDPSQADIRLSVPAGQIVAPTSDLAAKEVGVAQPGQIVFHVTTSRDLPFLLGGGIEPRVGARSKEAGEAAPRSYHFACAQAMDDALCGWLADAFDEEEDLAVVAVDVSGLAIEESPAGYEVQVLDHIDPERLCLVHNQIDSLTPSRLMALSSQAQIRLQARATERADAVDARQAHSPDADRAAQVAMSFAGERAQTADLQSLRAARWKVANGVQSREAWQTQGWTKGADGKWRFEIDDSRACVNLAMLRNIAQGPVCAGMPEVKSITYRVNKTANGQELFDVTLVPPSPQKLTDIAAFTAIDADTAEELLGKDLLLRMKAGEGTEDLIGDFEPAMCFATPGYAFGGFNALPLDRVLNHPALFKAYPELADVLVTVDPSFESVAAFVIQDCEAGGRSFERRLIRLRSVEIGQPQLLSALLHEVQHAIQEIEGFAPGGSAETAARHERSMRYQMTEQALTRLHSLKGRFPATYEAYNDMQTHFFACLSSHGIDAFGADGGLRDLMSLTRALQAVELPAQAQRRHQLVDCYRTCMEREVGEFGSPGQQLWGQAVSALSAARMATPEPAQEVYRKLAGEVEARNVQFRILFDEERRKDVEPADSEDVDRDEQIVMSCI